MSHYILKDIHRLIQICEVQLTFYVSLSYYISIRKLTTQFKLVFTIRLKKRSKTTPISGKLRDWLTWWKRFCDSLLRYFSLNSFPIYWYWLLLFNMIKILHQKLYYRGEKIDFFRGINNCGEHCMISCRLIFCCD